MTRIQHQVDAKFTTVLRGYTMTDYRETQALNASIQHAKPEWTINMMDFKAPTDYVMKFNVYTGFFEIVPA
jgi:hypothetical protein